MTKVSFEVDMELWNDYKTFAASCGMSPEEVLYRHVAATVKLNLDRIVKFQKRVDELVRKLNEEEQK